MANDSTRVPNGESAEPDDAQLDQAGAAFAKTREKVNELVQVAAMRHQRTRAPIATRAKSSLLINKRLLTQADVDYPDHPIDNETARRALMWMVGADWRQEVAFNSRIKHALKLGVLPEDRPDTPEGRRQHRRYLLIDLLTLGLFLQLGRALVDPAAAAAFIIAERDEIEAAFLEAVQPAGHMNLEIEIDAFAVATPDVRGRKSGRTAALALTGDRNPTRAAMAPPRLTIDLAAIFDKLVRHVAEELSTNDYDPSYGLDHDG